MAYSITPPRQQSSSLPRKENANPLFTFLKNYFFRLGFLDGKQGFLVHFYHSVYVSWK